MNSRSWQYFTAIRRPKLLTVAWSFCAVLSVNIANHAFATIDNTVTVNAVDPDGNPILIDADGDPGTPPVRPFANETVDVVDAINDLEIIKTAILNDEIVDDDFAEAGETITYTFDVRNIGNVTITNISVNDTTNATNGPVNPIEQSVLVDGGFSTNDSSDPVLADPSSTDGIWDSLAPGDTVRFTATYTVTQQDVDTLN